VLDRRETDPGPEEENGHAERADAERLQVEERRGFPGHGIRRDDGGRREEPEACLEMLATALSAPTRARNGDRCGIGPNDGGRRPSLALLDDRGERHERRAPARRCTLLAERHLIKRALAEAPQPAMERREVRGAVAALVCGYDLSQAQRAREIRPVMVLDVPERVLLARNRIAGQDAPSRTAVVALGQGEREGQAFAVLNDHGPGHEGGRDAEGGRPAALAWNPFQVGLNRLPPLVVDLPRQLVMFWG
jgi:hypothetical protein